MLKEFDIIWWNVILNLDWVVQSSRVGTIFYQKGVNLLIYIILCISRETFYICSKYVTFSNRNKKTYLICAKSLWSSSLTLGGILELSWIVSVCLRSVSRAFQPSWSFFSSSDIFASLASKACLLPKKKVSLKVIILSRTKKRQPMISNFHVLFFSGTN